MEKDSSSYLQRGITMIKTNTKQLSCLLHKIVNNWQNLSWWKGAIKTISYIIFYKVIIGNKGAYIMEENWDNLIILDACRYDMFKKHNFIPGTLEYRVSRGSWTGEFLTENFKKEYSDTIYITGNPLVNCHVSNLFYKIVPVWKNGWNEKYGTVLPGTMVRYALETEKKYPHKRLIVHFVQPHYPFLDERSRRKIGDHADLTLARYEALGEKNAHHRTQPVWDLLKEGKVDKDTIWEAYKRNLQIVLPYAKLLSQKLTGKTIITSDHGNLFGERIFPFLIREYGHPEGIYAKNLVKVPWLVIEGKERKKIIEERKSDQMLLEQKLENERIRKKISELKKIGKI